MPKAKTILLVEDDLDTRIIYSDALGARGYRVLTASQGVEGVNLARSERPDLILMDIRMPLMDGWNAVRDLKSDPVTAGIPVWGISAHFGEETSPITGFSRLLDKPLPPNALVSSVEAFLGSPNQDVR